MRTALLLLGVAMVAVPLAVPSETTSTVQAGPVESDTAWVRGLLNGVRGAPAVACEMAVQWTDAGWYRDQPPPDADSAAARLARGAGQRVDDPAVVPELVRALGDADRCVRRVAVRLLGRARVSAATEALVTALRSGDAERRVQGAIGLGLAGGEEHAPLLIAALLDTDAEVREAAAWALGAIH